MKIAKAIREIKWRADEKQSQINNRKDLKLTDLKVMKLLGEKDGLNLAIEILKMNM